MGRETTERNSGFAERSLRGELSLTVVQGRATVSFRGDWLRNGQPQVWCPPVQCSECESLEFDCRELGQWDSTLLAFVVSFAAECREQDIACSLDGLPAGLQKLISLSSSGQAEDSEFSAREEHGFCYRVGKEALEHWQSLVRIMEFTGALTLVFVRMCCGRARLRLADVGLQLMKAGPKALFIVSLISFLMGMILAFIGSIPLSWFSAQIYVASLIGIGMLRLMVPVMVGVVMAGRTGAAYAAELGTMQVNEELDAFRTMGIDPMEFLVMPRCLALTLMMPVLYIYADIVGVLGGMSVAVTYMRLSAAEFYHHMIETTAPCHLVVGLITTFIFGILVTCCGCYQGLNCGRSAESVGRAATAAVVSSIVCLVLATSAITVITVLLDIY